jgi:hypothetical protein
MKDDQIHFVIVLYPVLISNANVSEQSGVAGTLYFTLDTGFISLQCQQLPSVIIPSPSVSPPTLQPGFYF